MPVAQMFCRNTKVSFLLNLGAADLPVHTAYEAQALGSAKAEGKGGLALQKGARRGP